MITHHPDILELIGQIASMSAELNDGYITCNFTINGGEDYLHIDMFKGNLLTARPASYTVYINESVDNDIETQLAWLIEAMKAYRAEPEEEPIKPYDVVDEEKQNKLMQLLRS